MPPSKMMEPFSTHNAGHKWRAVENRKGVKGAAAEIELDSSKLQDVARPLSRICKTAQRAKMCR